MKKTVQVSLGYFKQGDDLHSCLEKAGDPQEALKAHAEQLRSVAEHLDKLAEMVAGHEISINADTHMIMMTCEEELAIKLLKADMVDEDPWEEDEDDDDIDDDELREDL
jgi:hypothetical protein